jgi:sugar phosphate isomerase/epimerase
MNLTRRTFSGAVLATAAARAKAFPKPIGVQLYTARNVLPKDPQGTLEKIAAIGYKEVEFYSADQFKQLTPIVTKLGMKPTSAHMPMPFVTGNWGRMPPMDLAEFLASAKSAGVKYVGMPYVAPPDRKEFGALCQKMNRVAEQCAKAGAVFFYHNHAFEFAGQPGSRVIDTFKKELDPKLVKLELDVFWVAAAGVDPVDVLDEWKGRVALLHVKDRAKGMAAITTESQAKKDDFKEVGAGDLDFKKILNRALSTGVDRFYVEQDQCPGDPLDSLKQSYDYLSKLSL